MHASLGIIRREEVRTRILFQMSLAHPLAATNRLCI